jgi:hypothetical protein
LDGRLDGIVDRPDDLPDRRGSITGDSVVGSWAGLPSTRTGRRFITGTASLLAARIGRCEHTAHWSDPTYSVGGGIEHRGDWCDGTTPSSTSRRCRRNPRPLVGTRLPAWCGRRGYGDRVVPADLPKPRMKCRAVVSHCLRTDQFWGGGWRVGWSIRTVLLGIAGAQRDWSAVRQRRAVPRERAVTDVSGAGQHGSTRQESPGCDPAGPTDENRPAPGYPRGMFVVDH